MRVKYTNVNIRVIAPKLVYQFCSGDYNIFVL